MKIKNAILIFIISMSNIVYAQSAKEAITKLAGNYSGEWTSYMMSKEGEIIKAISWVDTLKCGEPIITDTAAYVDVFSSMVFDNPQVPPYKMAFQEGYKLKKGKVGAHYFTLMGVEQQEQKIDENTYVISKALSPFELKQMGFGSALEATTTTTKVIMEIDGTEYHKITGISTVKWKEGSEIKLKQFVSLEGFHKKLNK